MKKLTVFALLCAMMALTTAATLPEAEAREDQTVSKSHMCKRATSCPRGWRQCGRRCFFYFRNPLTWAQAEKNCQSLCGNLASVHSKNEYGVIQKLIAAANSTVKEAWLGGSDAPEEDVWLWSDGSKFDYKNWCPGEPNNGSWNQHCLQMNYGGGKCWDDIRCDVKLPSVCAKKI